MNQLVDADRQYYRITDIEYTDDGSCYVGVRMSEDQESTQFKLSNFCHRISWLRNFQHPDLESIWQLAKRQATVSMSKRAVAYVMIKLCVLELALRDWEEEVKRAAAGPDQGFDDW